MEVNINYLAWFDGIRIVVCMCTPMEVNINPSSFSSLPYPCFLRLLTMSVALSKEETLSIIILFQTLTGHH